MVSTGPGRMLRVLTWNVHGCVGRSGGFDPAAIVARFEALDPDIAALQEVDARPALAGAMDTFAYLAEATGRHALAARTLRSPGGDYGHLLLSRWPLSECRELDLSVPEREPRAAVAATVNAPELEFRVLAAHLGLRGRERATKVDRIRGALATWGDAPGIVLGDFNEWPRRSLADRRLCPPLRAAATLPSFPSRRPLFPLDRIWCRAPLAPMSARTVAEARHESDHLPVLAELSVPDRAFADSP